MSTGSDIVIRAGELSSGGDLTIVAEKGQIAFLTAKGVETQQIKTDSSNLVWWKSEDKGYYLERIIHSHLLSGGKLTVTAGNGVVVEYDESTASASDAIRQLAKSPELAWMGELKVRNDVQWRGVEGAYEQWDHKAEGLTQGAAAVIALAVTVATQGTASGFAGAILTGSGGMGLSGVAGSVAGKAISAGFQAIVSRAAVSLANNKGDLGKVLKELGSSSSIKSVATSMVTAGLVAALPVNVIPAAAQETLGGGSTLTFAQQLQVNLVKGAIGAGVSTAVQGGDIGDALGDSLILAAVQTIGAEAATEIGIAAKTDDINRATQLIAHAALGCAMGSATGGGGKACAGGAIGGVIGEVVAEIFVASQRGAHPKITIEELVALKEQGVDYAKLTGALLALAAGSDVDLAAASAENAATNNALDTIWDILNVLYDGGKIGYGYFKNDEGLIEEGFIDLTVDSAAMLIPFVPAGATKVARAGAEEGYTVLYRVVKSDELAEISRSGDFRNPPGIEVKYFSTTSEGAASYARQATNAFKDGPYTIVETKIRTSDITPNMRVSVDRGIETVVVPTDMLPSLDSPTIWDRSPLPKR